jgi:hypothetical protein
MALSAAGILAILWVLLQPPVRVSAELQKQQSRAVESVRIVDSGRISIAADSAVRKKLVDVVLQPEQVTFPKLTVTGSIIARVRPGTQDIMTRWQFSTTELSTVFSDWIKSKSEIEFSAGQLAKTEELFKTQSDFLSNTVKRLEGLIATGSLPEKDLIAAKAELIQVQLRGEKEVFTAKSDLRMDERSREQLERQLSQLGIEPFVFTRTEENMVLLAANVPESDVSLVSEGQTFETRLYGIPEEKFSGHVETLGAIVTSDRRVLRALFHLDDPSGSLKPGMFAEVLLGTEPRNSIMLPATGLLRVEADDYVIVAEDPENWRVAEVKIGQLHENEYEVLEGLKAGDRIITDGAVLLLPVVTKALQTLYQR